MSAGGVDAEDVVGDDVAISGSAIGSRDGRSSHLHEDRRDRLEGAIGSLTPSGDQEGVSNMIGFRGRRHAQWRNFGCEVIL
jgi:hypothetical protein